MLHTHTRLYERSGCPHSNHCPGAPEQGSAKLKRESVACEMRRFLFLHWNVWTSFFTSCWKCHFFSSSGSSCNWAENSFDIATWAGLSLWSTFPSNHDSPLLGLLNSHPRLPWQQTDLIDGSKGAFGISNHAAVWLAFCLEILPRGREDRAPRRADDNGSN